MDTEFKMLQWTVPNFALWISTDVSTNGWLVGDTPGNVNRWTVVTGGTEGSHQHTRDESSAFIHADFYKIQIVQWIHVQMDNKVALNYLRVLLSFWLMFCQFQPGVAYKNVANKKSVHLQKFSRF